MTEQQQGGETAIERRRRVQAAIRAKSAALAATKPDGNGRPTQPYVPPQDAA